MIRVCLISSFPPSRGRLSEYAYCLVDELKQAPEICHLDLITDTLDHSTIVPIDDKMTLHRIWNPDNVLSIARVPFKILRLRPNIVHFNIHMAVFGHSRLANFVGLSMPILCRLMGFKTVVTLHNLTEKIDVEKAGFKDTALNRLGAFVATKLLSMNSAVTLTVKSYIEVLRTKYKCRNVLWIPHGAWNISPVNGDCPSTPETLLYIGHSGPYKDLELLFKAFKVVEQRNNGVKLIIAGGSHPNYPGFLEQYKASNCFHNVEFRGYVPEEALSSLFKEADVVILPYYTCTGTSGIAHLASSFGTPIVATDLPEFRELAQEGCGLILSKHDVEELARNIEYILENHDIALELRERNIRFARRRSWSIVASMFREVYRKLLAKSEIAS